MYNGATNMGKADSLSMGEKRVLRALEDSPSRTPAQIMASGGFKELVEVMNAASWLQSKGLVDIKEEVVYRVSLDKEGSLYLKEGFPERRLLKALGDSPDGSIPMEKVKELMGKTVAGFSVGWLKRKGWADISGKGSTQALRITDGGRKALGASSPDEEVLRFIYEMNEVETTDIADKAALELLKMRKEVVKVRDEVVRHIILTVKGKVVLAEGLEIKDEVTQLTPAMLKDGKWRNMAFRPYDIDTFAPKAKGGKLNPLRVITEEIRKIFLHMGFTEIDYDMVQPCFWNMDALFIPQDHAARDLQDTFYMKDPARIPVDPKMANIIRKVHEDGGGTGSSGWGYRWSKEEAEKVVLRTHTTVNSIRYLAEHPDPPAKLFTVGRVFRNEAVNFKHLPEFQQIEGIVMEEKASFRMLIGLIKEFYSRMGFEDIRIRPSFFPYTEPSLEVDAKFLGKWMEMGGAGVFRPEVTEPLGIRHPVLAWGLGLERLIMIRYDVKDIRELYFNDIDWIQASPLL
jgi:phenylalanyl-tRNA synthetase alpha chain